MNFLSDQLTTRFDPKTRSVVIEHPDKVAFPAPLVQIREETYGAMSFDECAKFLGARVVLLMPALREHFKAEIERMKNS
jgi:hypothetical protein